MKRWLITGVPGSGKTCIGNYLEANYDFQHSDFENPNHFKEFFINGELLIPRFTKNVVITWGFVPDQGGVSIISYLRQNGFKMFWLDGNRVASFRAFLNRGDVTEELYYLQMHRIENTKIVETLNPILINPFKEDCSFKGFKDIVEELERY